MSTATIPMEQRTKQLPTLLAYWLDKHTVRKEELIAAGLKYHTGLALRGGKTRKRPQEHTLQALATLARRRGLLNSLSQPITPGQFHLLASTRITSWELAEHELAQALGRGIGGPG